MSDKNKPHGLRRNLTNYGDPDFASYLRRSFARSMGYSKDMLDRPIVGIASSASGFNNCHRSMPELVDVVKRGVLKSGGLPIEFPTISLGEVFLSPTSMMFRNLMSIDVEEMLRAQPIDACVMIGACTDCRRFLARFRAGEVSDEGIEEIEGQLATTAGTCAVMGTASTMACITEALGMSLPDSAAIPAVHAQRLRVAEACGERAMEMARAGSPLPSEIITAASVRNAMRVLLAVGGSTNAIIHLVAIAGRRGIEVSLEQLNRLSDETPVLVDLKPTGQHYMQDLYAAGGMQVVLDELKELLELDCMTVSGQTLAQRLEQAPAYVDREVVRPISNPYQPHGGLVALFGSLAPNGAILKRAAANPDLFERKGRAVVFESLQDLSERIDSPTLDVTADDFLVLKNAGPGSASCMPEAGYLPIPRKLAQVGVKDMVRISDARMSGSAFGTVVLHVSPDAATGGNLALVRNGDRIALSVSKRRLELLVPDNELEKRRTSWRAPEVPDRGYARLYRQQVLQAPYGCDFEFLRGSS